MNSAGPIGCMKSNSRLLIYKGFPIYGAPLPSPDGLAGLTFFFYSAAANKKRKVDPSRPGRPAEGADFLFSADPRKEQSVDL